MYKWMLCLRYLRTRWIALASIISVTLGVATMIVVNSVMAGFSSEMEDGIHDVLSDVIIECQNPSGFPNAEWHMQQIEHIAGEHIAGMTASVQTIAMLNISVNGQWITRDVVLIGIDPVTHDRVGTFRKYLQHPENREQLSFDLKDDGYDPRREKSGVEAGQSTPLMSAGWEYRRRKIRYEASLQPPAEEPADIPRNPFGKNPANTQDGQQPAGATFDPEREQHTGAVLGIATCNYIDAGGREHFLALPGDDVKITFPNAGVPPEPVSDTLTIVDFYESKMHEYDSKFVFMPLKQLQDMRGMVDPQSGARFVSSIQIKLKDESKGAEIRDMISKAATADGRMLFPAQFYRVSTWRDKQGALLDAIDLEKKILNLLLFMIIAVAGFGILAIFFMIVVEKTRDIGVLKSLGASGRGVMSIFLAYGLSLGAVGAGVGLALGLVFVRYINEIAGFLSHASGKQVFDQQIYFFHKIPAIVNPITVSWIVGGAMLIAVAASVFPAMRAARMHPVEALRYE
jgi:lipoprotein-releasing system permease protein